jgi:hypothetical protein
VLADRRAGRNERGCFVDYEIVPREGSSGVKGRGIIEQMPFAARNARRLDDRTDGLIKARS